MRFCSLFQGFQGFCREENPRFFWGILAFFAKKARIGGSGDINQQYANWVHCKRRGPEKSTLLAIFWGTVTFSGAPALGHTPSTAGTFRKKFQKNSGKTTETLSELFLEFPSRVRLESPKPYNSRHLRLPEHFQNCLSPVRLGRLFFQKWFRRGPHRAGHGIPSSTEGISDSRNSGTFCGPLFRVT